MNSMRGSDDEKLDALFQVYRAACSGPDPSVNFMPALWARIESRQTFTFSLRRMASAFATAAVALSIALGVYMAVPGTNHAVMAQTYVDALADASTPQEYVNPVSLELAQGR